jgi:hypothetical protein
VQDKKKAITGRRRNTIKTSCFNLAITLILFVLASDNLIGSFILYCKIVAPKVKQELIDQIPIYAMV